MRTIRLLLVPVPVLVLLTLAGAVRAQDQDEARAIASLSGNAVYVGDSLILTIEVVNAEPDTAPDLGPGRRLGFDSEFLRQHNQSFSSTVIVNGRVTESSKVSFLLYYRIVPREAGHFEVPSIEIEADGQTLRTQPVAFRAVSPGDREDLVANLSVSSDSPFVGQPITVSLEVLVEAGASLNNPVFALPGFDERFTAPGERDTSGRRTRGMLEFLGLPTAVRIDRIERDGKTYDRLRTSREIVPLEGGEVELGPGVWICDFTTPSNRRPARIAVPTNTVSLSVRELPEEGRPANYTGLIGEYSVRARATPTSVKIGDPIRFEVTLEGPGDLRGVDAPKLEDMEGFDSGFRLAERDTEKQLGDGRVTFRYVLRVITDTVEAIPRVAFSSFDPLRGEYALLETEPIPLEVEPSRVVNAVDGESFQKPTTEAQKVLSAPRSLSANRQGSVLLGSGRLLLSEAVRSPVVIAIVAVPPVAYLSVLGVIAARRRSERGVEPVDAQSAARQALVELRRLSDDPASAVRGAFVLYESLRSALPREAVTPGEAVQRIGEEQPELAGRADELLEVCERARFGGRADACTAAHKEQMAVLLQDIAKQGVVR